MFIILVPTSLRGHSMFAHRIRQTLWTTQDYYRDVSGKSLFRASMEL